MLSNRRIAGRSLMLGAGCLLVADLGAQQPLNLKPGLWEVTSTTQMGGMPPVDTSRMTPQQREQVEGAMKGMGDSLRNGKPETKRQCMTKEKIAKESFQAGDLGKDCTRTSIASTSSLQEFKMVCTGMMKGSGTIRLEAPNPETVKGTMTMHAEGGHTTNMNFTFAGKWLGANCGDVK